MPNAKTVPSSNNQNNANPSETRQQRIDSWTILLSTNTSVIPMINQEELLNRLQLFREYLANQQRPNQRDPNQREPNLINEFELRFSEDDIDSNIDSDSDSDDGFPGLIDENGMPFDD